MARPDPDHLRQLLNDLVLDQVDPAAWLRGTFPEILRTNIDAGRLFPRVRTANTVQVVFGTGAVTDAKTLYAQAAADEIVVVEHTTLDFRTNNIDEVRVQLNDPNITTIWRDASGPFPIDQYIGNANVATQAWGATGNNRILLYGRRVNPRDGNVAVEVRLISAAAVNKVVAIEAQVTRYVIEDFPGT